jgi:hypothetical protein
MEGEPVVSRKGVLQEPLVKKQPETLFDPGSLAHKIKGTTHLVQVLIADAAPDTYHTLELIPVLASPDEELRIESVCVAGPGADVRVVRSKE